MGSEVMSADFAQLRQRMVDSQVRPVDVTKVSVLSVFLKVPREVFVPAARRGDAYADGKIEVAPARNGRPARFMESPALLARLIQLANIGADDFILDIGGATGYGAALMSLLGSAVVALENDEDLLARAGELFSAHGCENITMVNGNLAHGWAQQAPYDVIMLEGAVDFVPESLLSQLREGGRLVAVDGEGSSAFAYLYEREDGIISRRRAFNAEADKLPDFERKSGFAFR